MIDFLLRLVGNPFSCKHLADRPKKRICCQLDTVAIKFLIRAEHDIDLFGNSFRPNLSKLEGSLLDF